MAVPATPTGFYGISYPGFVRLEWNPVVDADHYRVARATGPDGQFVILDGNWTRNIYIDNTVLPNVTYRYAISAENDDGRSTATSILVTTRTFYGGFLMANSGYVMVDGTGLDLYVTNPQTIVGIYDKFTKADFTGKSVKLTNTKFNGMDVSPVDVSIGIDNGEVIVTWHVYRMTVTDEDVCTITNVIE